MYFRNFSLFLNGKIISSNSLFFISSIQAILLNQVTDIKLSFILLRYLILNSSTIIHIKLLLFCLILIISISGFKISFSFISKNKYKNFSFDNL
ncbi:hypothetical protein HOG21_06235 [bacterium]|nr:hypothetical protein [bacterium]